MEYIITEKQLKLILSNEVTNQEIGEQTEAEPVSSQPTAGTSSTQSGGQGYPSVGKWESGLTRGPANQIGVTKWSDIVGSTLKRGKANPLKEQIAPYTPYNSNISLYDRGKLVKKENKEKWINLNTSFKTKISIPKDSKYTLWKPNMIRQAIFAKKDENGKPMMVNYGQGDIEYTWGPKDSQYEFGPTEIELKSILPDNTLRNFTTKKDNKIYKLSFKFNKSSGEYELLENYFDKEGQPYESKNYLDFEGKVLNFVDEWGMTIAQVGLSIAVGFATGGSSLFVQAIAQVAVSIPFAAIDFSKGDNFGGTLSLVLATIPVVNAATKFGVSGPLKALKNGGKDFIQRLSTLKTEEQVRRFYNVLPSDSGEKLILTRLLKQTPKELENVIGTAAIEGFKKGVANGTIVLEKIPFKQLYWWKDLLVNGVGMLGLGTGAQIAKQKYDENESIKQKEELINIIKGMIKSNGNKKTSQIKI
jgi:hypothetical protein